MDYYKETLPLEFIGDVYDIMKDGDCLTPEKLNADVVDMLGKYLSAQQSVQPTAFGGWYAIVNSPAIVIICRRIARYIRRRLTQTVRKAPCK